MSSHILTAIKIEIPWRKKSPETAYFCSVFVWVNQLALPIQHLRLNEIEEFFESQNNKNETR